MLETILGFHWISILLILFTSFLVVKDRAFSKKVRFCFYLALLLCLLMSVLGSRKGGDANSLGAFGYQLAVYSQLLLRPVIFLLLVLGSQMIPKKYNLLLCIPAIVNVLFVLLGVKVVGLIIFSFYFILFLCTIIFFMKKRDRTDILFAGIILMVLLFAVCDEVIIDGLTMVSDAICMIVSVYYFYCVMRTYKRDGLTGLLVRHNLNYEMEDLFQKTYDIVLIDVDNFKLINDKYGHDKGDEVLVTIVETVENHLLKGCRMYRFGGDEFVIISRNVPTEELRNALEEVNQELAAEDLRISFGIVRHEPGVDSAVSLTRADKAMYENKRLLKSEDIWDDMTGLYNYRGFLDEMDTFRKAVLKDNHIIYLVGVDVEHLNNINMAYSYTEGNLVISTLARVLKTCLRGRDFIGHVGSDEFVIAVECEEDNEEYIQDFFVRIQENMDSAYELTGKDYTVKINVAKYLIDQENDFSSEDCVNNVLYMKQEDKENRRKTDVGENGQDYSQQDEKQVLDILDHNKLKYAFQPIVSAKDGNIVAYETLMRSDSGNMISPLKILKYAERHKRSYEVEKYTFFNVLSQVAANKDFPEDRKIFINSIPGYFLNEEDYKTLKEKYGHLFERMVVEITEQREIEDEAFCSLNGKRDRDGFQLAIDDYGSGCSNTNSLLRYMPQIVKLDRLLITGIDRNAKKQFFVNSIISFARENDMQILAEGVETESELKMVIRLGVDMIQGYITSKPSFEIIDKIPDSVKKLIIDENMKVGSNQRMVYTASSDCELSVVHLAMEDYSKINVSANNIVLTGSTEYTADMVIRIKEGINCRMTLSDVRLNSVDDEPCIDIGEGAHLTLNLEGHSRLNAKGIHVPQGSSLTVIGSGNMEIYVKGHECYAIGAGAESGFGQLNFKNSGRMDINVDGEECVGIGGGIANEESGIDISAGDFILNVAGVNAVALGYYRGKTRINVKDCGISSDFKVNMGVVIGSFYGELDTHIRNFNIEIHGSGTKISGIGSVENTGGKISLNSGTYIIKLNGQRLYLVGAESGGVAISVEHARLEMMGEGDNVMGFGSMDKQSFVSILESSLKLVINAANPLGFGSENKDICIHCPLVNVLINGEDLDISSFSEA